MISIYLAYSHYDAAGGSSLEEALAPSYDIRDRNNLNPEIQPENELKELLPQLDGTIALLTEQSLQDTFFIKEVENALILNKSGSSSKFLLMVVYGHTPVPAAWIEATQLVLDAELPDASQAEVIIAHLSHLAAYPELNAIASGPAYWLIKINDRTWPVDQFKKGQPYTFGTAHHLQQIQSDYSYFAELRVGDLIFAYALERLKKVIALFRVTASLHKEDTEEEVISLQIAALANFPIPLEKLASLSFYNQLNYEANEKLYPLDKTSAMELMKEGQIELKDDALFRQLATVTLLSSDTVPEVPVDLLDITPDVEALASVIAYREVQPPLSIGLFGNWGSGKSFFMQLLEVEIDRRANSDPLYCDVIVHVRFNSWHYSDANLWASLTSRIFEALNRHGEGKDPRQLDNLYNNLSSTNEQIKETNIKIKAATTALDSLQETFSQNENTIRLKAKNLEETSLMDIGRAVFSDPDVKADIEQLKREADFIDWKDIDKVKEQAAAVNTFFGKVVAVWRQAYSFRHLKLLWALCLCLSIVAAGWLLHYNSTFLQTHLKTLQGYFLALVALGTQIMVFIKPATKVVNSVAERLSKVGKTIAGLQDKEIKTQMGKLDGLKAELAAAEAAQTALLKQQGELQTKKALLESNLTDIRTGKEVVSFIKTRAADERYTDSLGIISWVRKDFEMLDYLLKQQHEAAAKNKEAIPPDKITFKIDRIILYIDDLDRCEAPTVVRVLEAIHLLMAFPLFVVVVGVDPRWMENALSAKFQNLLTTRDDLSKEVHEALITPMAYLEKIFQIPFQLKPVNRQGFRELVASQFARSSSPPDTEHPVTGDHKTENQGTDQQKEEAAGQKKANDPIEEPKKTGTSNEDKPVVERLVITDEEIDYLQQLHGLLPASPRTIKRYINIYRIIRSHSNLQLSLPEKMVNYQAVMVLLAILTGSPELSGPFFIKIQKAHDEMTFGQFLKQPENCEGALAKIAVELSQMFEREQSAVKTAGLFMSGFKENITLINRFAFLYDG